MKLNELQWWQKAVFYQIYPRSFADGNSDGIGDLPGIIQHLDYLQDLGIDAIWLSPHYPSPQADCGYDISDYVTVAPEYGTLEDFKCLLDGLHQRGMYLITDLVLNHTSHLHPWFQASRSSRNDPKRDWYIWRDGCGNGPPNNWFSTFGGSAWELDPATGQYYYHFFLKEQPDLNWRNPEVKQAMFDAIRFWLDLGVDGFRLDAIGTLYEDENLPDHPVKETQTELYQVAHNAHTSQERAEVNRLMDQVYQYQVEQPEMHPLMREMRALIDQYPGRMLVGENDELSYYGDGNNELHLVFNFPLMKTNRITPAWVRANQEERLAGLPQGAWPCNTLGNHDQSRIFTRYGDGIHDAQIARISLALMLTLWGTPFLYNGEEIGMTDLLLVDLAQIRDTWALRFYQLELTQPGVTPQEALKAAIRFSRDRCRSPMQWSQASNTGFSPAGVETWLPVNANFSKGVNVADQQTDAQSLLNFYRRLLRVRKANPALIAGKYIALRPKAQEYLAFLREDREDGQTCLVAMNMSDRACDLCLPELGLRAKLVFSSRKREMSVENPALISLEPFEVYIAEIT
jgi:alpha-glucosidase